jgi:Phytanoyl-CoA dioxygenase (PhyH)
MTTESSVTEAPVRIDLEAFDRKGYAVVPKALASDEVESLRGLCSSLQEELGEGEELAASRILELPEVSLVPFKPRIVEALRTLLGDGYTLFPNITIRRSLYVPWHVDEAFAGPQRAHVWKPGFLQVQCAIYLQDNSEAEGGGLDVIEASHKLSPSIKGPNSLASWTARRVANRFRPKRRLPLEAGDMVMWHARLIHRSTPASAAPKTEKYGVYFGAGRAGDVLGANEYLVHLVRKRYRQKNGQVVFTPRFAEILDLRFPGSYPEHVVEAARAAGVTIASF